jgi:hypothetical protein
MKIQIEVIKFLFSLSNGYTIGLLIIVQIGGLVSHGSLLIAGFNSQANIMPIMETPIPIQKTG